MLENTLIGNEAARFNVSKIIKTLATPYSSDVKPLSNTNSRLKDKKAPQNNEIIPITEKIIINRPFKRKIESKSLFDLYFE